MKKNLGKCIANPFLIKEGSSIKVIFLPCVKINKFKSSNHSLIFTHGHVKKVTFKLGSSITYNVKYAIWPQNFCGKGDCTVFFTGTRHILKL